MGGNWKQAQREQGLSCSICGATARASQRWQPQHLCQLHLPVSDLHVHGPRAPGHAAEWWVFLSSFSVFLFSPELLSLWESNRSSVVVILCYNFCTQLAGILPLLLISCCSDSCSLSPSLALSLNGYSFLALASLMDIWFSLGYSNICPRDLENELPLTA